MVKMITVGVLAIQGAVAEHINCLQKIDGIKPVEVKTNEDMQTIDGLIIPGGESTTIGKLLNEYEMIPVLRSKIQHGMPIWGTCAGMILLAKRIVNQDITYLDVLDVDVRRNAYGSQLDSFQTDALIPKISSNPLPLTFIRAPYIEKTGSNVDVLLELDEKIVAVEQDNILATSFHPELTDDLSFHKYFVQKVRAA